MSRVLLTVLVCLLSLQVPAQTAKTVEELSTALKQESLAPVAFSIKATVSAPIVFDRTNTAIPIADETGTCVLRGYLSKNCTQPDLGETILARGTIRRKGTVAFSPDLSVQRLAANRTNPKPKNVTIAQLKTGSFDWHYVRLTGLVRDVLPSDTNASWGFLVLASENDMLSVAIPLNDTPIERFNAFLRASVAIDGFCCLQDGSLRLYQGRILQASGLASITRLPDTLKDPFSVPDIRELRFLSPAEIAVNGLARAKGLVISRWGDHNALLQTEDGDCIRIISSDCALPARNDCVEVSGFPQSDLFHITLRHALWRTADPIAVPNDPPKAICPSRLQVEVGANAGALASLHGKTIRFTARIRNLPDPLIRKDTLLVEDDTCLIPVDVSSAPLAVKDVLPGTLVEITATCVLGTEAWSPSVPFPQIHGFTAILNDINGLRVIARPPWWTFGRIMAAFSTILIALVILVIYGQISRARAVLKANERTRLAVELHDTLAQSLTGVSLELGAAKNATREGTSPVMTKHLDTAARVLTSCRQELRNCLWDLRNKALEEENFETAIRTTLRPLASGGRFSVRFKLPRHGISDSGIHALLRVIRELVINAFRHGRASYVRIAGCVDNHHILCSVIDNGIGFDAETAPGVLQGHFGLQGLRERIAELHGTFVINSSPGKGTKAKITLPEKI